ncbi:MAG: flagellar hook-length control protein FliK [Gammaproteobacteria bacterium]|nr:flagellar hook-length control protein FliK [Gammaproteobacteria bacterium]
MFNLPPLHSSKPIDAKIIPVVLQTWQIGQIFESRAKTSSNAQGEFLLQIGQHLINAKIKTPIQAGEELKLQVSKLGFEPVLKIITPTPAATDAITLYLRQAVPQNNSIQKLLNLVQRIQPLIPSTSALTLTPVPIQNKLSADNFSIGTVISASDNSVEFGQVNLKAPEIGLPAAKMTLTEKDNGLLKVVDEIASGTKNKAPDQTLDLKTFSRQLQTLLQIPLKAENASADKIQLFLQQSGFNLENKILKNSEIPVKDLKFNLIQLKQTVDQILAKTQVPAVIKNPELISTLAAEYRLPAIANYLLYGIAAAEKAEIIGFISHPTSFNNNTISDKQSFIFQAVQKFSAKEMAQLKQWIQFIPTLTEIRQLIEQSINTITNHQLQALQVEAEADSAFMVLFNLLVSKNTDWIDLFNIKVNKQQADEETHWSVTIQMEIAEMGLLEARLILVNKQLHAGLTSESNATHQLINEHLHLLQSALTLAGFDVATISSKHDKIKPIDQRLPGHGPLLEDKA